jgi:prevent-host-death family protein
MAIGIRELRADLAAHVRRAAAGEPTVVSVNGEPAAVLGPLAAEPAVSLDALVAAGAVVPPRRSDRTLPSSTVAAFGNVRLDRLLAEIRGRA